MDPLRFDHPVPELIDEEDAQTLASLDEAAQQLNEGRGILFEELRKEFDKRCSK